MRDAVLVINAGSSSVKFSLFSCGGRGEIELSCKGQIEAIGLRPRFEARDAAGAAIGRRDWPEGEAADHARCLDFLMDWLGGRLGGGRLVAAGHRVVHGGRSFAAPVRIDAAILDALAALVPLAPLHQPHNLAGIRILMALRPELPQIACFDTAFHRRAPGLAHRFALPRELTEAGIERYGFHGLSYEYIAGELPRHAPALAEGRVVVAHLGNGASMCAIAGGVSRDSTMSFTALDGLPMGTRCGALDPGVVLYLLNERGMDAAAVEALLYRRSGLLGVSGLSSDMRALLASDDPRAREAVDLFVFRIGRELGALAAVLGGLDALVFTGGIGENAVPIRARVCRDAAWLGLRLDEAANAAGGPRISAEGSAVSAWVLPTNEELVIARHTLALLAGEGRP
ncbi:MAG TPA: acetate/propionate family kinase [Stellaceae bacterium]|nr:acetate/propionate family kinase [Stellaceae bacterium]